MKIFKMTYLYATLLVVSLVSCKDTEPNIGLVCDWPAQYKYEMTLTDQVGRMRSILNSGNDTIYVIDAYGVSDKITSGSLLTCNLPGKARVDGKAVKISGYLLTFPNIDRTDIPGNPFEITSIELIE
ncbi:hypothetical protein [Persicitalea jodogahamensis]|uniref:Lipoprotein n=1 Tax=Persicitalea jodogahamensis TaxID=402147 RepID=A0A8J3GAX0_9BACT|nr:hypothetical protein [Persicitalea jodogahamensis]GHB86332.1 hypothetical protein GCM10007390_47290 [Persicitalea jodogahamensis]